MAVTRLILVCALTTLLSSGHAYADALTDYLQGKGTTVPPAAKKSIEPAKPTASPMPPTAVGVQVFELPMAADKESLAHQSAEWVISTTMWEVFGEGMKRLSGYKIAGLLGNVLEGIKDVGGTPTHSATVVAASLGERKILGRPTINVGEQFVVLCASAPGSNANALPSEVRIERLEATVAGGSEWKNFQKIQLAIRPQGPFRYLLAPSWTGSADKAGAYRVKCQRGVFGDQVTAFEFHAVAAIANAPKPTSDSRLLPIADTVLSWVKHPKDPALLGRLMPSREQWVDHLKRMQVSDSVVNSARTRYDDNTIIHAAIAATSTDTFKKRYGDLYESVGRATWKEWAYVPRGMTGFLSSWTGGSPATDRPWIEAEAFAVDLVGIGRLDDAPIVTRFRIVRLSSGDWVAATFPPIKTGSVGKAGEPLPTLADMQSQLPTIGPLPVAGEIENQARMAESDYLLRKEKGVYVRFSLKRSQTGQTGTLYSFETNLPPGSLLGAYFSDPKNHDPYGQLSHLHREVPARMERIIVGPDNTFTFNDTGIRRSPGCLFVIEVDPASQTNPQAIRLLGRHGELMIGKEPEVVETSRMRRLRRIVGASELGC